MRCGLELSVPLPWTVCSSAAGTEEGLPNQRELRRCRTHCTDFFYLFFNSTITWMFHCLESTAQTKQIDLKWCCAKDSTKKKKIRISGNIVSVPKEYLSPNLVVQLFIYLFLFSLKFPLQLRHLFSPSLKLRSARSSLVVTQVDSSQSVNRLLEKWYLPPSGGRDGKRRMSFSSNEEVQDRVEAKHISSEEFFFFFHPQSWFLTMK